MRSWPWRNPAARKSHATSPLDGRAALAAIWLGVAWASLLGEFFATVYCDSLLAIAVRPSLLLLALLLAPGLLALPPVRTLAPRAPVLAMLAAPTPWIESTAVRAALLGFALAGVSICLFASALHRPRANAGAWLGGVLLCTALRWCCTSLDPLAHVPLLVVACSIATTGVGLLGPRLTSTAAGERGAWRGVPFGAVTFLVHGWLFGPTVIPRWSGLGPENGALVVLALAAGFALHPVARTFAGGASVAAMALFATTSGDAAWISGCVLALFVPAMWCGALTTLAKAGPRAIVPAALTHLALFLLQATAFASDYAGGSSSYPRMLAAIAILTAALAALPMLGRRTGDERGLPRPVRFTLAALALVAAAMGSRSVPRQPPGDRDVAMTWNVQQGFDMAGRLNLSAVVRTMRSEGVTVVALQESCAARPTSAGRDLVAWLAAELGMHAACGPGPAQATFGVALLSSHPILDSTFSLVPSDGDHAVLLLATVDVRGQPLKVAVTHFGGAPEYRPAQARAVGQVLAAVTGPLLLLGDFNLEGDAPPIASLLREARLQTTATTRAPTHRGGAVDHVFVRDVACDPAQVPDTGGTSDHRPVVVPFTAPPARPR